MTESIIGFVGGFALTFFMKEILEFAARLFKVLKAGLTK